MLKNSHRDGGLNYTRHLVSVQTDYAVDKILRQHSEVKSNLTILDAGAGAGYMSVHLHRRMGCVEPICPNVSFTTCCMQYLYWV
jgi:2-polyprenyl-3-methyl-5-hydroxy-6-metoxy-1,4-benzoquinol methylase